MINILLLLLSIIFLVVAALLVMVILLQPGKSAGGGGGLGATHATGAISDTLGATEAEKTLAKWTGWLAAGFIVLCLSLTVLTGMTGQQSKLNLPSATPQSTATTGTATVNTGEGSGSDSITVTPSVTPEQTIELPVAPSTPAAAGS